MHTKAHGHVTAEEEGRDQPGEEGKEAQASLKSVPIHVFLTKLKLIS